MTLLPFILPSGFTPAVKEDEKVKEGQVLAENSNPSEVFINVAQDLGIPIRKVRTVLKKNPGDVIGQGDIIAEKKGLMGGKMIKSTISGTALRIDEETGSLVVSIGNSSSQAKILSPADGTVSMVSDSKILVKTDSDMIAAQKFSGGSYSGEVEKLKPEQLRDITSLDDKIVVVSKISREDLAKLLAMGVGAVVSSDIDDITFRNLAAKDVNTPVLLVSTKDLESIHSSKKITVDGQKGVVLRA